MSSASFSTYDSLVEHMREEHGAGVPNLVPCEFCGQKFTVAGLTTHIQQQHQQNGADRTAAGEKSSTSGGPKSKVAVQAVPRRGRKRKTVVDMLDKLGMDDTEEEEEKKTMDVCCGLCGEVLKGGGGEAAAANHLALCGQQSGRKYQYTAMPTHNRLSRVGIHYGNLIGYYKSH